MAAIFLFYGFTVRSTEAADLPLAQKWTAKGDPAFWLRYGSYLASIGDLPIAFFRIEHIGSAQARIHFQAGPEVKPKTILRGITKMVPLIEKALAVSGVKAVFFTSHSKAMASFMEKKLNYQYAGDGGEDGVMMAKRITPEDVPKGI